MDRKKCVLRLEKSRGEQRTIAHLKERTGKDAYKNIRSTPNHIGLSVTQMLLQEKRIELFGTHAHALTMAETIKAIDERINRSEFTQHVVLNVAKVINMQRDITLARSVQACHVVNIDGMGVVWGGRMLGHRIPERVAGIDLFLQLVALAEDRKYPIYLLGATKDVVTQVVHTLKQKHSHLKIAGFHDGYFWDNEEAVVENIRQSGARLLFVAITSPKKENFINRWQDRLGVSFVMGVGGSFDVVAGKVRRAPLWMQRTGLEWFYRVVQEPRRMWKRYLITNCLFIFLLLRSFLRHA